MYGELEDRHGNRVGVEIAAGLVEGSTLWLGGLATVYLRQVHSPGSDRSGARPSSILRRARWPRSEVLL
jgi:hypothetical protein